MGGVICPRIPHCTWAHDPKEVAMTEQGNEAEAIFLAALEKGTPGERAAYVEGACAGKPELRQRVRELLAAHEESQGPLDAPPPGFEGTTDQPPIAEGPGTVI